jgi:hypothetical protein
MLRVDLRRAVVVVAVCVLSLGAPASAGALEACPSQPLAQVFLPWGDPGRYGLVPDGGMESRDGAWRLGGAAGFAGPNEPFFVRSRGDQWSLSLPAGASGASAPTCIELGHPTLRFFLRNAGPATARLEVSVEYVDPTGIRRSQPIAVLAGSSDWAPTPILPILVNLTSPLTAQNVALRFTPSGGSWQIDDVFVDPYGKG